MPNTGKIEDGRMSDELISYFMCKNKMSIVFADQVVLT
jgi:hypothetical protein